MKKRIRSDQRASEEVLLNLTPLIDVIFVLLVMFMLVAPMLGAERVELANAATKKCLSSQESQNHPIRISVEANNSIWLNSKKTEWRELPSRLAQLKKLHPKSHPLVFHDKRAEFGTYQNLKTALEKSGFQEMQIVLNPPS